MRISPSNSQAVSKGFSAYHELDFLCVGAFPPEVDPEEKDSLVSGLANSTRETSAQVQLGPGTQNPKELPSYPSPSPGGARAEDVRPDKNRSRNPRVSQNLHRRNQSRNQNQRRRGNPSTYEGKQKGSRTTSMTWAELGVETTCLTRPPKRSQNLSVKPLKVVDNS